MGRLKVGEWTVIPEQNRLERNRQSVRVERKVMQVLVLLAEKPGKVLSKEYIFRQVWPDAFVSDEVLTRCISELRKVFEDNPKEPTYIQTIPKGGYRLLATVVAEDEAEAYWRQGRHRLGAALAVGGLLLAGIGFYFFFGLRKSSGVHVGSLAVLPFTNLSGDSNQDYFVDGLADELTTRLSNITTLRVISRASAMHYKGTGKTTPEIARELNVDALVEGSVLRSGDRIRISAQLIQANSDKNLWAQSYDRDLRDILALQAEIAATLGDEIKVRVSRDETQQLRTNTSINLAAYDAYLKGNYHWEKFTPAGMKRAIDYYQQAIAIDPNYAVAYVGLADAYHESTDRPPREVIPKAKAALQKALQLDANLAEAHSSLGWVKWIYDWDWPGAESEFQRARQLNPNHAGADGMYAEYLDSMGRFAEAAQEREAALRLSPVDTILYENTGEHYLYTREYDKAIDRYREALDLDPNFWFAHQALALTYELKGAWKESVQHMEIFAEMSGTPEVAAKIKSSRDRADYKLAAQAFLDDIRVRRSQGQWVPSTEDAHYYVSLGQSDEALSALERAVEERDPDVTELQVDPVYDPIRSDPRFEQLVRRVGLPQ